ncbi:NUDIX domain-containing protein [Halobacillus sp. BAB-2008]|uniref:NUDIX hydrolase n=1 Tax=Halobacillus sp. BAB-2008 TaxID=1246484 RepID=UPI0002A50DD0|nr:NUDIX domain-containing protein [Halobacillus sp. BAB-2008]ELK46056.1 hypothetical protein D479_12473 [Halobacillus sp. BAB-2008]
MKGEAPVELWDIHDQKRRKTGQTVERGRPMAAGEYHIVVHVWIKNSRGEVFVTKRAPEKHFGGYWEGTGGSVTAGEDSYTGALREVKEEIGIDLQDASGSLEKSVCRAEFQDFMDVWVFQHDFKEEAVVLQQGEVREGRWVTRQELEAMVGENRLVPTLSYVQELF